MRLGGNQALPFLSSFLKASLVETMKPGSVPDLNATDDEGNCRLAMDAAESRFGVPKIITAEEMANPSIPELAIMAYTVQFTKVSGIFLILLFRVKYV